MKFFIRATIFGKFDANFTQLKAVDSEGIKVVAQGLFSFKEVHLPGKLKQKNAKIDYRKIKAEPVAQALLEDVRILPNILAENAELKQKVEQLEKRISSLEEQQMRISHLENFMLCLMQSSQAPGSLQAPLQPSTTEEVNNPTEAVQQSPEVETPGLYFFSEKLDFSFVDEVLLRTPNGSPPTVNKII